MNQLKINTTINTRFMKTRSLLLIVAIAAATLSFTFTSVGKIQKKSLQEKSAHEKGDGTEPVGGFIIEDRL